MKTLREHLLASAVLGLLTSPAWTQDAENDDQGSAGSRAQADQGDAQALDTILVTARKRSEALQQLPAAITAFTADDIENTGIESIDDLALLTTGLNYSPIFGNIVATPIIRGSAQTFGAPNVGVFLDGVYLTGKSAIDVALADLERVEVVKGPQSALYGRNTFAGAINYITKQPSFEPSARFKFAAGNHALFEGFASYAGPISETFAFRVAARQREHNGFFQSSLDGGDIDFESSKSASADLAFVSDYGLDAIFRVSYVDDDNGQPASQVVRANGLNRIGPIIPPSTGVGLAQTYVGQLPDRPTRLAVNTTRNGELHEYGYRENAKRASLSANYVFDFATLSSITAWSRRETEYQLDGDNTVCDRTICLNFGPPIAGNTSRIATSSEDGVIRDLSQELRLASEDSGPLTWLAGIYYYHSKSKAVQRSLAPITGAATFGFPFLGNRTESAALFASVGYQFNERWGLTVEGRSEHEEQEFLQAPTRTAGVPAGNASLATFDLNQDFDFFTPKAVLDFKASDNALLYFSAGKGVKSGGFNSNLRINADQRRYDEESSRNYELGAKIDWMDGRLRTNAAVYRTDWDDQQIACQNPVSAGGTGTQRTYVCNVGEARINGLELDAQMQLGEAWTAALGYTYTDAGYLKFVDDSLAATLVAAGRPPYNFKGRSLPYVPENDVFVSINGEWEINGDWSWFNHFDINRQSKQYLRADNLAFIRGRTVANLRLGVRSEHWTFTGSVDNLFDDDAAVTGVRFFDATNFSVPAPLVTWSAPRQFSFTVQYDF